MKTTIEATKYVKKPVVIEAIQLTENNVQDVLTWCNSKEIIASSIWGDEGLEEKIVGVSIRTLEGDHIGNIGDYIIKGIAGEFYPCKPDIFEATYDVAVLGVADFNYVLTKDNVFLVAEELEADSSVTRVEINMTEQHLTFACPQGFFAVGFGSTLDRTAGQYKIIKGE